MKWLLIVFLGTNLSVVELDSKPACEQAKDRIKDLFPVHVGAYGGEEGFHRRGTTMELACIPKGR